MFRVAIGLLVVAIIAAVFGFGGIASTATGFAKIVFVVALILAVLSFLMGGRGGGVVPLLVLGTGLTLFAGSARADQVYVEPAHRTYHRQGLVLGGGLGLGHIACDGADCDGVNEAAGLSFDLGGMVGPNVAILFDAWGMSHRDGDDATFSQAILTGAIRFWPARIVWVQGGVGFAQASWHYNDDIIDYESRSDSVPAVMGAVGVELVSSRTFALDLQLRGGTGFFEDDTQVRNLSLGVGVNWY